MEKSKWVNSCANIEPLEGNVKAEEMMAAGPPADGSIRGAMAAGFGSSSV